MNRESLYLIECLNDPSLRWQDNPRGRSLVAFALRFPNNHRITKRALDLVGRRRLGSALFADPFLPLYPSPGELADPCGRIRIVQIPSGEWLSCSLNDLRSHCLVSGPTGGGKSIWLRGMIIQALSGVGDVTATVFDRKGTLDLVDSGVLLSSGIKLNIFDARELPIAPLQKPDDRIDDAVWGNSLVQCFAGSWNLVASMNVLLEVVHGMFQSPPPGTWDMMMGRIVSWNPISRRSMEYKDYLLSNVRAMFYGMGEAINAASSNAIARITRADRECNVIRTDGLPDVAAQLYPALFLLHDYEYRKVDYEARRKTGIFILDDSMGLFRRDSGWNGASSLSPLDTTVFMSRVFGISLVVAAQNISSTSRYFVNNAGTIVATGGSGDDLKEYKSVMNLNDEQVARLCALRRDDGKWAELVALSRNAWRYPVLGKFPYIE